MNMSIFNKIVARIIYSFDMTESEWKRYKKEHPLAEKKNHHIIPDPKINRPEEIHKARCKAKSKYFKALKEKHPNFVPIVKKNIIQHTIKHGIYSVISAGVNFADPNDVKRSKIDPEFIRKRTESLRNDLDSLGVRYTEIIGSYDGEEPSFLISHDIRTKAEEKDGNKMIMVHDYGSHGNIIKELNRLGEKYNQDSVAHSKNGIMEWHYTTGLRKGNRCIGEETNFVDASQNNFYSEARIGKQNYTKWSANMNRCLPDENGNYHEDNFQDNPYKP